MTNQIEPQIILIDRVYRQILGSNPHISKFPIDWVGQLTQIYVILTNFQFFDWITELECKQGKMNQINIDYTSIHNIYFEMLDYLQLMIAGYLQNTLIAKSNIQEVNGTEMQASLDRRTTKIYMDGQSHQKQNPLDLVQITSTLPQFSCQQNINQGLQNFLNSNFIQQIQQLASPTNNELIYQIKDQAKVVRMHYQI